MAKEPEVIPLKSNSPPLREQAKMAIDEKLAELRPRLDELVAALAKAECKNADTAGKCADLVKQFRALKQRVDAARKEVKEPYKEATDAIDGAPKSFVATIDDADKKLRDMLAAFDKKMREEEAAQRRAEEARQREEQARLEALRRKEEEAARGADVMIPPPPEPEPEVKAKKEGPKPVAQGDYGAGAHRTKRMVPQITDMYALPPEVIEAPDVKEAALKVVRALKRANPDLQIPGVKMVEEAGLMIR